MVRGFASRPETKSGRPSPFRLPGDRSDAGEDHCARAAARLAVLRQQHKDLARSLAQLLKDIFAGREELKVYRQFKMYNDPAMNPAIYGAQKRPAA